MNNYNKFYLKMLPLQQRRFSKFAILLTHFKILKGGIKPNRPQEIAPAVAVIAKGISSVTNKRATTANKIKHFTAWDILFLLLKF